MVVEPFGVVPLPCCVFVVSMAVQVAFGAVHHADPVLAGVGRLSLNKAYYEALLSDGGTLRGGWLISHNVCNTFGKVFTVAAHRSRVIGAPNHFPYVKLRLTWKLKDFPFARKAS